MAPKTVAQKIIDSHLISGDPDPGQEIGLGIDQTLTQDATGTLVYLEFETMGLDRVKTKLSVSYVDHNLLQTDFRNADDHRFLLTVAARYGILFSPPGNGISHQVHLERFSRPGNTLLGSDSHTPTSGAAGMLAIGAGGLNIAMAMAGSPFYLTMPEIWGIRLTGKFPPWVSAKDLILYLLGKLTVKGGVGKIFEYFGPGLAHLEVNERATIANMGAELGLTASVFPSDDETRRFLIRQGRAAQWQKLTRDPGADYHQVIEVDLGRLEPLVACPSSPDRVKPVKEVEGIPVAQVIIGSCLNSSYRDLMIAAKTLKGKAIHPQVSLEINPGSLQVLENLDLGGGLLPLIQAGARIHQCGCLGCIGMGQAPATGTVSVRTFPRNFPGRSGTPQDQVYLASPETAVASALFGQLTDPRHLGPYPRIGLPKAFRIHDRRFIFPPPDGSRVVIERGPNIKPLPRLDPLPKSLRGEVLLKAGDHITTDHILPAGSGILPLRSNLPAISQYVFSSLDPTFAKRAMEKGTGLVAGGENYGQGSSREHAALAPRFLGVRVKLAKSFARIHRTNLINFGILPLVFTNPLDYPKLQAGDPFEMPFVARELREGKDLTLLIGGLPIPVSLDFTPREREILLAGGLLNLVRG